MMRVSLVCRRKEIILPAHDGIYYLKIRTDIFDKILEQHFLPAQNNSSGQCYRTTKLYWCNYV